MKNIAYEFEYFDQCNMCGATSSKFKILGKRLNQSQGRNPESKPGITVTVVQCKNCGLIFPNPIPKPIDIQDHYGVSPDSYWDESYFKFKDSYFSEQIEMLSTRFGLDQGARVLDIGAGIGKSMKAMERAGYNVSGIEPSETFYKLALERMNIRKEKLQNFTLEEASFDNDYFDFINFGAVLEHLYNPSVSIEKAMTWLKPGGIVHIEVPSSKWFVGSMINLYYRLRRMPYVGNLSPMHPPYHLYEFDLKSFDKNGKLNNYIIDYHQYYVCKTYLPKQVDFFIKPYMAKTKKGMQLAVWLRKG